MMKIFKKKSKMSRYIIIMGFWKEMYHKKTMKMKDNRLAYIKISEGSCDTEYWSNGWWKLEKYKKKYFTILKFFFFVFLIK